MPSEMNGGDLLPGKVFRTSFTPVGIVMCNCDARNRIRKEGKCIQYLAP